MGITAATWRSTGCLATPHHDHAASMLWIAGDLDYTVLPASHGSQGLNVICLLQCKSGTGSLLFLDVTRVTVGRLEQRHLASCAVVCISSVLILFTVPMVVVTCVRFLVRFV
jgi:hypothetical protein